MLDLVELLIPEERLRTACSHCDEAIEATLDEGRAWFAEHLAREHPEVIVQPPAAHRPDPRAIKRHG